MIELNVGFPVNVTEVRPDFGNNRRELQKADSLVRALQSNKLLTINCVGIKGYASPEGRYAVNERLAKGRSEGFKQYLVRNYSADINICNSSTSWIAEDWEGLERLVEASNLPNKDEVLLVIRDKAMAPDTKEVVLQKIGKWSDVYKPMLNDMFPKLRRIELRVDYTVQKLDDNKARELLYTQPDMLSLEEIYRVARYYEPGSKQYREVYEIAAQQYPDNVIANNNAAAALLLEGNTKAAVGYLNKIKGNPVSYLNYGTYYYIHGNREKAVQYYNMAREAGIEQAAVNLQVIK